jgi:hypothetical protein
VKDPLPHFRIGNDHPIFLFQSQDQLQSIEGIHPHFLAEKGIVGPDIPEENEGRGK